jgi:hypothetical protein
MATALVLPFFVYVLLSIVFFGPAHFSDIKNALFTPGGDPESFVWFLNWWPFALAHHLNPFITRYVWYPQGFNLAWATAIPALSLVMAPVTLLWGAGASFNLLALLGPALSATTCFYLIYFITKKYMPSLIGGNIYGFSSYELGQLLGHTNLYINFLIPLAILLFLLRLHGRLNKPVYIVLLTLTAVFQFGTSIEIFTTCLFFGAISLSVFYFSSSTAMQKNIIKTLQESLWAFMASLVILSPYIYYLVRGYRAVPRFSFNPTYYSSDLLNFIIPTTLVRAGNTAYMNIAWHFTGDDFAEAGAYLGLPLILIMFHYMTAYWRKPYTKAIAIIVIGIAVASLGTVLHLNGLKTRVPLPWALTSNIPILRFVLPARFSMYVSLLAAVVVGLWLAYEKSSKYLALKYAAVLFAVACMMPNPSQYSWEQVSVPGIFAKDSSTNTIKQNENIVVLPYGSSGSSMYYQYVSGMKFTQSGGYVGYTPSHFINAFNWPPAAFKAQLTLFCEQNKVKQIMVTPQTAATQVAELIALEWPKFTDGAVTVINCPSSP